MKRMIALALVVVPATVPLAGSAHGPNFVNAPGVHCHGAGGNSNETWVAVPGVGNVGVHFTGPGQPANSHLITPSHDPITEVGAGACVTP